MINSQLDQSQKARLLELRDVLCSPYFGHTLATDRGESLRFRDPLERVLRELDAGIANINAETRAQQDRANAPTGLIDEPSSTPSDSCMPAVVAKSSPTSAAGAPQSRPSRSAPLPTPPNPPEGFAELPPADAARAREVWWAAHRLRQIIEAWQEWWRELRDTGDANPGLALRYSVAAGDAFEVLYRYRVSASPFDFLSPLTVHSMLPPIPDGMLADEYDEPDGQGGTRHVVITAWQDRMRHDERYWGGFHRLNRLLGHLAALIRRLRDAPLSVVAGATPANPRDADVVAADAVDTLNRQADRSKVIPDPPPFLLPPDGQFEPDGFRYRGAKVRFGKSKLQPRLVAALWSTCRRQPRPPRDLDEVMDDVYGHDHRKSDNTLGQPIFDTNGKLRGCGLAVERTGDGKVVMRPISVSENPSPR